jgi:predicted transcriptional regulator
MAGTRDYRGAVVEDLDRPPALTIYPSTLLSEALDMSYERSYSYLPVVSSKTKRLLGYLTAEQLENEVNKQASKPEAPKKVADYYVRFTKSSNRDFQKITPDTALEDLEAFFNRGEEFAVITDDTRKFVLGVATQEDLEKFVQHRPLV